MFTIENGELVCEEDKLRRREIVKELQELRITKKKRKEINFRMARHAQNRAMRAVIFAMNPLIQKE